MKEIIDIAVQIIWAGQRAYARKGPFLGTFALVFVATVVALGQLGLLPSAPAVEAAVPTVVVNAQVSTPASVAELPLKIEIPKIALVATIANPSTTDVVILDDALLKGAVRYPTSAKLGEVGNVVLFGHSSYLPVVLNQAFKTFNGIQKLVAGDIITVSSADTVYTYRVRDMKKENANNAGIDLDVAGRVLTLATCNSFGEKADRFVITADFVESHSIPL
ncbi:MAG: sortase [Patescibacteria group bacterium]|nr:sortase [Patescibacteria group bacterium]